MIVFKGPAPAFVPDGFVICYSSYNQYKKDRCFTPKQLYNLLLENCFHIRPQ